MPLLPGEAPPPPPIVVFPLLDAAIPGISGDPWASVWRNMATRRPERYVMAPTDTAAVIGDQARLLQIVRQMGGDSGLVVVATPQTNADGRLASLDVGFVRQGRSRQASGRVSFTPDEGEATDAFLRRAATGSEAAMVDAWKRMATASVADRAELAAWVPVDSLGDWLKMQKTLRQVEGIRRVDLTMMTRREMLVSISYTGTLGALRENLEDADLVLFEADGRQLIAPDTSPLVPSLGGDATKPPAASGLPPRPQATEMSTP